jgi:hypothetical protein
VQNRVQRALPRLPDIVRQIGVTTEKQSPNLTMVVHLISPDNSRDSLYLRNYAQLQLRDQLLRLPGMGNVLLFGSGDYAMRIWLNPQQLAARALTASDVVNAVREQNNQVAAGVVGAQPAPPGSQFQLPINVKGRLTSEDEFADIVVRADPATGAVVRIKDVGRVEMSASTFALRSLLNNKDAAAIGIFQAPGSNALRLSQDVRDLMERSSKAFPPGVAYSIVYDPTRFVRTSIEKVVDTLVEAVLLVVLVVILFLQTWGAAPAWLFDQHAHAVRAGAGDRDRRGRRHRRRRERRAQHREWPDLARCDRQGDAGGERADRRDRAGAGRGVRAAGLRARPYGPVLSPVRRHHRHLDRDLGVQLADAVTLGGGNPAAAARCAQGPRDARHRQTVWLVFCAL